jgi:integrase
MSGGPRRRVTRGIYLDRFGYEAHVCVRGQRSSKRFPSTQDVKTIKQWRREEEDRLGLAVKPKDARGTLAADVNRYIALIKPLKSWREIRSHLRAWIALHPHTPRWRLTAEDVRTARSLWRRLHVSPKTVNHRVAALARLYRVLDGKRAATPCGEIEMLEVPSEPPKPVPAAVIRKVLAKLEQREHTDKRTNAKKRARFMVLASCGVRPSEMMRAQPGDVELKKRWWRTRDGKGGFRPGGLPLTREMVQAWKVFIAANAWGKYSTRDMAEQLRALGWPEDRRPYELRHSLGLALDDAGTDLADISAVLGHSRPLTTRSHYVGVRRERLRSVISRLEGRLGWPVRDRNTGRQVKHSKKGR